jgi:hypothetical protein
VNAIERRVVLADDARRLRRQLGVTAWAVLEDLLTDATPVGAELAACSNVRRVAEHLGVSKDTAARAVNRLMRAGIVERGDVARSSAGVFLPSTYLLRVEPLRGAIDLAPSRSTNDAAARRPRSRQTRSRLAVDQLTLIDLSDPAS